MEEKEPAGTAPIPAESGGREGGASHVRWLFGIIAEAVVLAVVAAVLQGLEVVQLTPLELGVVGLVAVLLTLSYFFVREHKENRRLRLLTRRLKERASQHYKEIRAEEDSYVRLSKENSDLVLKIETLTDRLAQQTSEPVDYVQVDRLFENLDSPGKEIVVSRWWPKGVTVRVVIWSTDKVDAVIAFYPTATTPAQLSKDHSSATIRWSEGRTRKWEKEFQTDTGGIWYIACSWPKGNLWGSDVEIRVYEKRPIGRGTPLGA